MQEQQESQGDDEDVDASTYFELAKLFLDAEMVDYADVETQAAAAESFLEVILAEPGIVSTLCGKTALSIYKGSTKGTPREEKNFDFGGSSRL